MRYRESEQCAVHFVYACVANADLEEHCVHGEPEEGERAWVCEFHFKIYTKISLTELVNGLVLLMLPIYFNALERTTVLGITGYL